MKVSKSKSVLLTAVLLFALTGSILGSEGTEVDTGITSWMLTSTALVLLMVPGLAMFYGGLVRTKNVMGTMMHSFVAMCHGGIVGLYWLRHELWRKYSWRMVWME